MNSMARVVHLGLGRKWENEDQEAAEDLENSVVREALHPASSGTAGRHYRRQKGKAGFPHGSQDSLRGREAEASSISFTS